MTAADFDSPGFGHRAVCYECFRPVALCYCRFLHPVDNRTPVLIIQHPRERFHPIGTARIAKRCLQKSEIIVDWDGGLRDGGRPLEISSGAGLLFPGPEARDLATIPASDMPSSLVVLDGTWGQARSLFRHIKALHSLPRFCFDSTQPSQYRIRKEPSIECVSTVEAVGRALQLIEPETKGLDQMHDAFTRMIDLQISTAESRNRRPRYKVRNKPAPHPLPSFLRKDFERIVVAYGEAAVTGPDREGQSRHEARRTPKELICWTARRLSDGASFFALIKPSATLSERRLCPMGLSPADLDAGCSIEEARDEWHAFTRSSDLILTWNKSTLHMLQNLRYRGVTSYLKTFYWTLQQRRGALPSERGSIDEIFEREGLELPPTLLPGRPGSRLEQLDALARLVQHRGQEFEAPAPQAP